MQKTLFKKQQTAATKQATITSYSNEKPNEKPSHSKNLF